MDKTTASDNNHSVLDALGRAYQVATELAVKGHHIRAVCAGQGQPQVWVANPPAGLASYAAKHARDCAGAYQIRCANLNGVAVNWIERKPRRAAA